MNKKKVLFFALFCFALSGLQAQNTSLGLRLGMNFANIHGQNMDNKMKLGMNFGALVTHSISPSFGVTGEVNYSGKGAKAKNSDLSINLNYLEIPIYANFFIGDSEATFRPKLMLGGYFGYLMSAKSDGKDIKEAYKPADFGGVLGLGGHYRIGDGNWLNIDVRYALGLTNIIDTDVSNVTARNGVLSLNLAYTFPLGNY